MKLIQNRSVHFLNKKEQTTESLYTECCNGIKLCRVL